MASLLLMSLPRQAILWSMGVQSSGVMAGTSSSAGIAAILGRAAFFCHPAPARHPGFDRRDLRAESRPRRTTPGAVAQTGRQG